MWPVLGAFSALRGRALVRTSDPDRTRGLSQLAADMCKCGLDRRHVEISKLTNTGRAICANGHTASTAATWQNASIDISSAAPLNALRSPMISSSQATGPPARHEIAAVHAILRISVLAETRLKAGAPSEIETESPVAGAWPALRGPYRHRTRTRQGF